MSGDTDPAVRVRAQPRRGGSPCARAAYALALMLALSGACSSDDPAGGGPGPESGVTETSDGSSAGWASDATPSSRGADATHGGAIDADGRGGAGGPSPGEGDAAPAEGGDVASGRDARATRPEDADRGEETRGGPTDASARSDTAETADDAGPDAAVVDASGADTSGEDASWEPDGAGEPGTPSGEAVQRIVVAGDSWSTGFVFPTVDALAERGLGDVAVSWEGTALAGSRAAEWVVNHAGKLTALVDSLDASPPAGVLLLVLGGNDLNKAIVDSKLGKASASAQAKVLDDIAADLLALVQFALAGRPHLRVVIVGYDYFHFDMLNLFISLEGLNTKSYNELYVQLEQRKLAIASAEPGCEYAHNLGWLQHHYGDSITPPFMLPTFDYAPGWLPKPGVAPSYDPFPGGTTEFPSPLSYMPDGLHPPTAGFRSLIEHTLDQGLQSLLEGGPWAP